MRTSCLWRHTSKHPKYFHRFDAVWTPTIMVMESEGVERFRIEGYLSKGEFRAHLEMGLACVAFMNKHWADAGRKYAEIAERYPDTKIAPEAVYWKGVCRYKETNDHT
ncbi:MAG TPA: hypothetical protein VFR80_16685, partial [Pyrinomonadaceae bacterium]|nr:hypothetical protein [Pyrinomonadaceae bacterium]